MPINCDVKIPSMANNMNTTIVNTAMMNGHHHQQQQQQNKINSNRSRMMMRNMIIYEQSPSVPSALLSSTMNGHISINNNHTNNHHNHHNHLLNGHHHQTNNYNQQNHNSSRNNRSTSSTSVPSSSSSSSPSSLSLIMAINRFKNSVKNMKETVLIPTRLNDLATSTIDNGSTSDNPMDDHNHHHRQTKPRFSMDDTLFQNDDKIANGYSDSNLDNNLSTVNNHNDDCYDDGDGNQNKNHHSILQHSQTLPNGGGVAVGRNNSNNNDNLILIKQQTASTTPLGQQQNLYEQFKLLELIDKILSSDTILSQNSRNFPSSIRSNTTNCCGGYIDHHHHHHRHGYDKNNNPRRRLTIASIDENSGKISSNETGGDESIIIKDESTINTYNNGKSSIMGGKPSLVRQLTTGSYNYNGNKYRSNSPDSNASSNNGQLLSIQMRANNDSGGQYGTPIITDCSLLKIKEKLEYHLICLKSLLNMMSDGAELITHTYLDDIQSGEDRFDQSLLGRNNGPNGSNIGAGGVGGGGGGSSVIDGQLESLITPRHYYTSN
ncbi:hypothetical protein DERF_014756 [Dermatophagoides farinae]|uniref:Uncharacterized protein n=2 Tax=Dermatophagoides farinae TaxID=6954 RepID=A0A922KTQ8_DERFA|nr:hypothetical protein DERF_014756 [Dermatophagoides farinae]